MNHSTNPASGDLSVLQCLIFDVDGTLADTERDGHRVAFNQAFAECGLDWHWDEPLYGQLLAVTGGKERMRFYQQQFLDRPVLSDEDIKEALIESGASRLACKIVQFKAQAARNSKAIVKVCNAEMDNLTPQDAVSRFDQRFLNKLHALKTQHYLELLKQGKIPLRPGIKRLINEARQAGLTLAIATTTTPVNVTTLLENTLGPESLDWFSVIAAGDVVPAKKPAPDIYHWTLERLGLPPQHCLALEDSRAGLLSAVNAGVATAVTFNDYTRDQDFSEALAISDHLGEPDNPCRVIKGPPVECCIDIAYLDGLLASQLTSGVRHVS